VPGISKGDYVGQALFEASDTRGGRMSEVIDRHAASGRRFSAGGVGSFTLDAGSGEAVVCMHGVPVSSFLYRRLAPALADRGLRGIAFDLPGLGLADRPDDFDYTWTGLGRWALSAVDALELDRFHLVVHDIGGPVGFELAAAAFERIASITVLNTLVAVDGFTKPWPMRPFGVPGIGELWLRSMAKPPFRMLMRHIGLSNPSSVPNDELDAHLDLLRRGDGGRAFLRIMRGFETTAEKQGLYERILGSFPVQVVWGELDTALTVDTQGEAARRAAGLDTIVRLPGKHFFPEDHYVELADHIKAFASPHP
jgi:pimeloyl-ACP methyl ester carboxylesterase